MKRRIFTILLAASMLMQSTFSVAAAEIISEELPDIVIEEQGTNAEVEEITPYEAELYEENVGIPLLDSAIQWDSQAATYWNSIDWSSVVWQALSGVTPIDSFQFPNGWADKVDWSKVNWEEISWDGYAARPTDWKEIEWDNVSWADMYWNTVDWNVIKDFVEEGILSVSFEYPEATEGSMAIPVIGQTLNGEEVSTVASQYVVIKIKGKNVEGEGTKIPPDAYVITVEQKGEGYDLKGIWNSFMGTVFVTEKYSNLTYFNGVQDVPKIVKGNKKYPLTDATYWNITVDDSDCTFASLDASTRLPLPEITIKSKDGNVILERDKDYTIEDTTEPGKTLRCGEHKIKITAMNTSTKVGAGAVEKSFTVHYADIEKFYKLEGVHENITVKDLGYITSILTDPNGNAWGKKDLVRGRCMYLEPKNNEELEKGLLPRVTPGNDGDPLYGSALFNLSGFLKAEYSYDSKNSPNLTWSETFDLDDWWDNHSNNTLRIRVSVDDTNGEVYKSESENRISARYLTGSIYANIQIAPYSLEEINPNSEPKTKPTLGGNYYLAVVNPVTTQKEGAPPGYFSSVKDGSIPSVTYNGMAQKPDPEINFSVYHYESDELADGTYNETYDEVTDWDKYSNAQVTYENNIDAGKGKIRISFDGEYTGDITREFDILPKDIADDSVKIQAQDFLYDGNTHPPVLYVNDDKAKKVLVKGEDYTVSTTGNITSPGTITATVTGINNYQGTKKVKYKIVPTSTIVVGTKLEQVANIPKKLDDQKYTGQPLTPEVVITGKNTGLKLVKDKDYTVTYLNNIEVGEAYAVVKGIGSYGGTYIIPFNITEKENQKIVVLPAQERDLKKRTLKSRPTKVKYTVAPKTSTTYKSSDSSIVTVDSKTGAIEYKNIGTAVITISAAESDIYNAATKELTVKVLPETPKNVAMKFVKGVGIIVTGGAVPEATQYQIRVQKVGHRSVFKNFDNNGPLSIEYTTKTKGKFNVWVRAYKVVDGVEHFSEWSKKKTLTVN